MMLTASSAIAQEKVNIGLDLTISGLHAGWLVAQKMGYFKDQGLDVTITRGYGSGDTAQKVENGEIDVGFHHAANLVIANSEGADLRVVMSYLVQELCAAFSAVEHGNVTTPKKMEGLDLGRPAHRRLHRHPAGGAVGRRRRRQQGQHASGPAGRTLPDAGGQHHPGDRQLSRQGLLHPPGAGEVQEDDDVLPLCGLREDVFSSITVTRETMEKRPEMIEKVIAAVIKGLQFTARDPDEAARIIMELHPQSDAAYIREFSRPVVVRHVGRAQQAQRSWLYRQQQDARSARSAG